MTNASPAPIPTERLIKLSKLRGDKFQEEAAMARELLSLRQQAQPTREEGWSDGIAVKLIPHVAVLVGSLTRLRPPPAEAFPPHMMVAVHEFVERAIEVITTTEGEVP